MIVYVYPMEQHKVTGDVVVSVRQLTNIQQISFVVDGCVDGSPKLPVNLVLNILLKRATL